MGYIERSICSLPHVQTCMFQEAICNKSHMRRARLSVFPVGIMDYR